MRTLGATLATAPQPLHPLPLVPIALFHLLSSPSKQWKAVLILPIAHTQATGLATGYCTVYWLQATVRWTGYRLLYGGGLGSTWRLEHLVGQGSSKNGGGVGQGSVQVRVP